MSEPFRESAIEFAALMPDAPVLVPAVGGERSDKVSATVRAMRDVARRLVDSKPEALVLVSPHSPRRPDAFGIWAGERLHWTLAEFGAPEAWMDLPADRQLAEALADRDGPPGRLWRVARSRSGTRSARV